MVNTTVASEGLAKFLRWRRFPPPRIMPLLLRVEPPLPLVARWALSFVELWLPWDAQSLIETKRQPGEPIGLSSTCCRKGVGRNSTIKLRILVLLHSTDLSWMMMHRVSRADLRHCNLRLVFSFRPIIEQIHRPHSALDWLRSPGISFHIAKSIKWLLVLSSLPTQWPGWRWSSQAYTVHYGPP